MPTYAIGDVQGCFDELQNLLKKIHFNTDKDTLWFTGDLINRGPQSLKTLQFVKDLGGNAITVLGNHDLHFLAVVNGLRKIKSKDNFQDILSSPDAFELANWLRFKPLIHYDPQMGFAMIHAGLAPMWDLSKSLALSKEVEDSLQSDDYVSFLANMYGNEPDLWDDHLQGYERLRVITNYFTRARYLDIKGRLDLGYKGADTGYRHDFYPWFSLSERKTKNINILFGHWAALQGKANTKNVYALDTGCCWGNCLTAMRLEDKVLFHENCQAYQIVDHSE